MNFKENSHRTEEDDLDHIGFNDHQMAMLRRTEAFTAEREREIQQVVESVSELAQIMKDLSVLVIDQGTIVDRINYHIQNVASSVVEGLKQLQKELLKTPCASASEVVSYYSSIVRVVCSGKNCIAPMKVTYKMVDVHIKTRHFILNKRICYISMI